MKNPRMGVLALLVALLWVTGCATTAKLVTAKDDGMSQLYRVSRTGAWKIAKTVLHWEGSDGLEEHRAKGLLVARNGNKWVPWGTLKAVWVERVDRQHTRVTVVSKRHSGINLGTISSEAKFHKRFAQALKIVKRGRRLPSEPPE
ncbi:MAG: hypothetical protein ACE5JN_15325 [Candidatus Methylomirabilia bacterium]